MSINNQNKNYHYKRRSQFGEMAKVAWMILWRSLFIGAALDSVSLGLVVSVVAAWFIVYGFGRSVHIWPVFMIVREVLSRPIGLPENYLTDEICPKLWRGVLDRGSSESSNYQPPQRTSYRGYSSQGSTTQPRPYTQPKSYTKASGTQYYGNFQEPSPMASNKGVYWIPEKRGSGWLENHAAKRDTTLVDKTENPGTPSPWIPRNLDKIELLPSARIHGKPGVGLSEAGFGEENAKAGQKGEESFAKVLQETELLSRFETFWSLALPDENLQKADETDIDAVLVGNGVIFLVDLKSWKQGDLTYYNDGDEVFALDNANGNLVSGPHKVSPQMARAREAFEKYVTKNGLSLQVVPMVVLMPTNRGAGGVEAYWPGRVVGCTLEQALERISRTPESFTPTSRESSLMVKLSLLMK